MRLGIGHPGHKDAVPRYVLHDFAKSDQDWLEDLLRGIGDAAQHLAAGTHDKFMSTVALRTNPPRSSKTAEKPKAPAKSKEEIPPEADTRSPLQKLVDKFR